MQKVKTQVKWEDFVTSHLGCAGDLMSYKKSFAFFSFKEVNCRVNNTTRRQLPVNGDDLLQV